MSKVLIASHANMASGTVSSLDFLSGMGSEVEVIDAYVNGNDDFSSQLDAFLKENEGRNAVIFTDLEGGSVNQKILIKTAALPNITVVTQFNLAVVIATVLSGNDLDLQEVQKLVDKCQVKIAGITKSDVPEDSF